jgi:thiol-disulfide isomerase/thioredoxin
MKFLLITIFVLSSFINGFSQEQSNNKALDLKAGDEAPAFYLKDLQGKDVFLRNFCGEKLRQPWKNKTKYAVILSFFASWCEPCKREVPILEEVAEKYKDKKLKIFLVNVGEKKDVVKPFVEKQGYSLPVLLDVYKVVSEKKYNIKSLPRLIIIDPNGVIRLVKRGFHDREKFTTTLQGVLDEMFVGESGK